MKPFILTSNFVPTDDNIQLLSKGPNYCFINTSSMKQYINLINDFIRKLQWNILFKKNSFSNKNRFGLKKSVNWVSDKLLTTQVKSLSSKIFNSSLKLLKDGFKNHQPFHTLPSNVHYSVADKGSNWVITSNQNYINEGLTQLNTCFYEKIKYSKFKHNLASINRLINFLYTNKYVTLNEKRFLLSDNTCSQRNFYMLPKIHKNSWTIPNIQPKGRPIVNCKYTETYKISIFIDYFLQPLVQKSPSYIKDSFNFTAIINNINILDNDYLVTIDINSLYTNIPIDGAISAVKTMFTRFKDTRRPDSVIINLLKIILYNNDFSFNNENYLQKKGVAMGQRFAPSVANLYLTLWEENLFNLSPCKPLIWNRYIDDIFTIWRGDYNDLNRFLSLTNSIDSNITITSDIHTSYCTFLDLHIFKLNNQLCHKIHFKETNNHSLLDVSSNHPKHTFKGIIYSQIRRWAALTSNANDFSITCNKIFPIWRSKGYTRTLIRNCKNKVLKDLNLITDWKHSFTPCQSCPLSSFVVACNTFTIHNIHYKIIGNYSCFINNIIYIIFCKKCSFYYVGQSQDFHARLGKHLNAIKNKCPILLHKHFWNHCTIEDLKCFIIDSAQNSTKLKLKESNYIKKFNTKHPNGFNIIKNYSSSPSLILPFNKLSYKIASNVKKICQNNNIDIKSVYKQGKTLQNSLNN